MSQSQALAQRAPSAPAHISPQELLTLVDTPEWRQDAARALVLANSGVVPDSMKGNPSAVLAAMWVCDALDIERNPINFSQLYSVHGRPAVMAQLTLGLAHRAGHRSRWITQTDECQAIEMDGQVFTFTIAQAIKAGLTRGPNKETWEKYPGDLLGWKAVARAVRRCCPEVLLGLKTAAPQLFQNDETSVAAGEQRPAVAADVTAAEPTSAATAGPSGSGGPQSTAASGAPTGAELGAEAAVELIPVAKAKQALVAAAVAEGISDIQAKAIAARVWHSYRRSEGEEVAAKTLAIMCRDAKLQASAAASVPGEEGLQAAAEDTLFGGSEP